MEGRGLFSFYRGVSSYSEKQSCMLRPSQGTERGNCNHERIV